MKVWERRLMKDFQVAPIQTEEQEDHGLEEIPENETSLSKFRRIAKQVAQNSSSYKWGQIMQEVGVGSNTQIGRCRSRTSFKNQQNLQKAMIEARKLVEKSPIRSRSISPIEVIDPTTSTLMELLKNITEECGNSISPGNTLDVNQLNQIRSVSPNLSALSRQLQSVLSTPSDSKSKLSSPMPGKSPSFQFKFNQNTQTPKPGTSEKTQESCKSPDSEKSVKCQSPPQNDSAGQTSPDGVKSPESIKSPPPSIKITSSDKEVDVEINKEDPVPLVSDHKSSVKVIKRKQSIPSTSTTSDIAVQRPTAIKPQPGQGMIPPPPDNKIEIPKIDVQPSTPTASIKLPKSPSPPPIIEPKCKSPSPTPPKIISEPPVCSLSIDEKLGSQEKLIPVDEPLNEQEKIPSSPACLRPIKKIEDVKTIKRQPKSGWL